MAGDIAAMAVAGPRYVVAPTRQTGPLAAMIASDEVLCAQLGMGSEALGRPERAEAFLQRSDLVLAVTHRRTDRLAGAVTLSRIDLHSRHAFIATFAGPDDRGGLFFEAVVIAIEQTFSVLDLQRLRFDVLSANEPQFARVSRYAEREGTRRDWCFMDGRWQDAHLYAISRLTWERRGGPMARRLMRAGRTEVLPSS